MKIITTLSLLFLSIGIVQSSIIYDGLLPRYYSISTTPEDILTMSARSVSPTQLEVQLTNSSRLSVNLRTAGREIRSVADRSYILHNGKKIIVKFPLEVDIPSRGTTTLRLEVPQGSAPNGSTLVYNTISLLTPLKGLNEGFFSLRATISQ